MLGVPKEITTQYRNPTANTPVFKLIVYIQRDSQDYFFFFFLFLFQLSKDLKTKD